MKKLRKILKTLGPGFITGASDDDPSGIATYSQTGAQFGYQQLWTAPFSFPFMTVIQEMCGRIGMVTGRGISGVIKKHYSPTILYFAVLLLFIANTINIGANLGAMASSAQLLLGLPFYVWLIIMVATSLILQIFVSYPTYSRVLKYLTLSLLAYIVTVFIVKQNWTAIAFSTLLPSFSFDKAHMTNIVAILGTTISPYLFFWQADEEVEEEIEEKKLQTMGRGLPAINIRSIRRMRKDTIIGMFLSNLVMFFIITTAASTLHVNGITEVATATDAAKALKPLAGEFAFLLFALGIIGSGFLAVPILAGSASYALAEAVGWREGLYLKFSKAHGFYGIIALATILGIVVNFTPIKPFQMLYYTAILNGMVAPFLMVMILLICNNKKIMGNYTNSLFSNMMGIIITAIMAFSSIFLLVSFFL